MATRKSKNYVNGPQLHQALLDWYESGEEKIPDVITLAIMQICERLGTKNNFRNYTYIDEMISEGLLSCTAAVIAKKYDPYKYNNPFAYFTQIAYNEFRRVIKLEQKETYVKHKSLQNHVTESALNGETIEFAMDDSGRIDDLVNKFEKKDDTDTPNS